MLNFNRKYSKLLFKKWKWAMLRIFHKTCFETFWSSTCQRYFGYWYNSYERHKQILRLFQRNTNTNVGIYYLATFYRLTTSANSSTLDNDLNFLELCTIIESKFSDQSALAERCRGNRLSCCRRGNSWRQLWPYWRARHGSEPDPLQAQQNLATPPE